jgi:hypothetical protein
MTITKDLRHDNRGAVMLTGLFLAFFLVGALWYVIGIGDAIVFRNRMQEAADSAVFSSAAIHAKGMNFVSACNLIMLVMALVHIVAGIIQDVTILACLIPPWIACAAVPGAVRAFRSTSELMKTGITATSNVASAIAIATPWAGTARGFEIGREYGNRGRTGDVNVIALGASNFPGLVSGRANGPAMGLPVRGEKYSELCARIGKDLGSFIALAPIPYAKVAGRFIGTLTGSFLRSRYCNEMLDEQAGGPLVDRLKRVAKRMKKLKIGDRNFDTSTNGGTRDTSSSTNGWSAWFDPGLDRGWGDKGFLVTNYGAENGTDSYQIWAIALNPKYLDTSERKVSVAGSIGKGGRAALDHSEQGASGIGYFAQAEFYYDCGEGWRDDTCDGGVGSYNASFGINWRARLRRLETPNLMAMLVNLGTGKLRGKLEEAFSLMMKQDNPWKDKLLGKIAGASAEFLFRLLTDSAQREVVEQAGRLDTTNITGSYH